MRLPALNIRKVKGFLYRHRYTLIIIIVSFLIASGAIWYGLSQNKSFTPKPLELKKKVETRVPAPYTGELVDPSVVTKRPLAVVIENFTEARPQSGYNDADIVYETLAEGGITRTLAIFQSKDSNEIGPVRSARVYFIDWATQFGAVFAHVGGSSGALSLLRQLSGMDLNQFYNANAFWRSNDRFAPHNVYTTTDKLYQAAKANGYATTATPKWLSFKDDAKEADRPASQKLTIDFSYFDYRVSYNYDPKTNSYLRLIAGVAAKDRNTGIQIAPKNIIIELTSIVPFTEDGVQGVRIADIGSGDGYLVQDGKMSKITWSKASREAFTRYKDEAGKEINLNRGQTWVEVVPKGNNVTSE